MCKLQGSIRWCRRRLSEALCYAMCDVVHDSRTPTHVSDYQLSWDMKQQPLSLQMRPPSKPDACQPANVPWQNTLRITMATKSVRVRVCVCVEGGGRKVRVESEERNSSVSQPIPLGNQAREGKKQSLATGVACYSKSPFDERFMRSPGWKWFIYFSRGCEIINLHCVSWERRLRPPMPCKQKAPRVP